MPKQGLHLITPTSVASIGTGSSATISANGSVSFSACTGLELRGVFSADYDNYQIVCRTTQSTTSDSILMFLMSGTTVNTNSNYAYQRLTASGTTVSGTRNTAQPETLIGYSATTQRNGVVVFVYGPYLSQPTVGRSLTADSNTSARIFDHAWSHSESVSFDGTKLTVGSGTVAGLIAVYGMRK